MYTNQRMRFGYHREKAAAGEPTLKSAIQLSQKGGGIQYWRVVR